MSKQLEDFIVDFCFANLIYNWSLMSLSSSTYDMILVSKKKN